MKTVKVKVEGYGYFGNFLARVDESTHRVLDLTDQGPTTEEGLPLTGMSRNRWNRAWEGAHTLFHGKNLEEVESLNVVDATSGATASGEAIKQGVLQALRERNQDGGRWNENYLQPVVDRMPWDKEVAFSLDLENPPPNSDYQIEKEYIALPGEEERSVYYAKERGEWKENLYVLKKSVPGQRQRVVWKDRSGQYQDIQGTFIVEPSLRLEERRLISNTVDVPSFVRQISRVQVKPAGARYGDTFYVRSGDFVFRGDGYVNEELKKFNGSPVFEAGKTYDLTIISDEFGNVTFSYTATGEPLPKKRVEEGKVEMVPRVVELSERVTLQIDGSKVPDGQFKWVELIDSKGERVPSQYQREKTYVNLQNGTLVRPEVGEYRAILKDVTGVYEDVEVPFEVENIFSIEGDRIVSTSESFSVEKYLEKNYGRYPKIKVREIGKEEIKEYTIEEEDTIHLSERGLITPSGKIRKDLMIEGKLIFSSEKRYEILIEKEGMMNPWLLYQPEGIEEIEEEEILEEIPFRVIEKETDELFQGERKTEVQGISGKRYRIKSYIQVDGKPITEPSYSEEKVLKEEDEVILVGRREKLEKLEEVRKEEPQVEKTKAEEIKIDETKTSLLEEKEKKEGKKMEGQNRVKEKKAPKTSDQSQFLSYILSILIAISALICLLVKKGDKE